MLRWFRKYNKIILVVGCTVLMVAFLVPQAIEQFSPNERNRTVATVGGEDVSGLEMMNAGFRLELLQALGLGGLVPYDREQWFLLLRDADAAGIGASDVEVSQALASIGIDPAGDRLAEVAEDIGQQPAAIRAVMRDLLVAERYRLLASGHRFDSSAGSLFSSPGLVSIGMLQEARRMASSEQAQQFGPVFQQQLAASFGRAMEGTGRLSPPFVTAVLFDEAERVSGALAVVEPEVTDGIRARVGEEDLQRLFTEYSGFLPGRGAPYPFGYRVPDRVKMEVLTVPAAAVGAAVEVGTVDVLEAFRAENPGETPSEEQRAATRERLVAEATQAKLREIASMIRGELESARRGIPTGTDGRLELDEADYDPPALDAIADAVADAHGVRPTVTRRTDDWLPIGEAASLDGLATSGLPDLGLGFGRMLQELPQLDTAAPDPAGLEASAAATMAPVQVGVAMPLLTNIQTGDLKLVRVTAADPTHEPESLDAVRDEVAADAALVGAYEDLLTRKDELLAAAAASGLDGLPDAGTVVDVPPFPQRTRRNSPDGQPVAPPLPGVGRAAALVDAAFEAVESLEPGQDVSALPDAERLVAAGVDGRLALALFRIDTLERPTRSDLAGDVARGELTGLDQVLLGENDQNPLSADALRERLEFVDEG